MFMTLSFVLFLFLAHLGIGIVVSLLLVPRTAGVQFFRFNAGFTATLLLVALALRPEEVTPGTDAHGIGFFTLVVSTGAILIYWATVGRIMAWLRPVLLWLSAGAGTAALITQAIAVSALSLIHI